MKLLKGADNRFSYPLQQQQQGQTNKYTRVSRVLCAVSCVPLATSCATHAAAAVGVISLLHARGVATVRCLFLFSSSSPFCGAMNNSVFDQPSKLRDSHKKAKRVGNFFGAASRSLSLSLSSPSTSSSSSLLRRSS